ncbi:MAG: acylphosphatase [Anaerolineales bacterium]|nr:acylphosphatase [Anaerolineales bacterium]
MVEQTVKCAHVYITGRVQGVNFRYYTRQQANSLGVKGWVRNLMDGRVEALFVGEGERVQRMIDWCHVGPRASQVDNVEVHWEEVSGEYHRFEVRQTAYWGE